MTRLNRLFLLLAFSCLLIPYEIANANQSFQFDIDTGHVKQTGARCISGNCTSQEAKLFGTLTAEISDDSIVFSNANVSTSPDLSFRLPDNPNEDSNGVSRNIDFSFDGNQLRVSGKIDSRAFDGPLEKYEFVADVITVGEHDEFDQHDFFTARYDFRKCASPWCGGFFVKAVNQQSTRCADGISRKECYVASIDLKTFNQTNIDIRSQTPILLQGKIQVKDFDTPDSSATINPSPKTLGVFIAKAGYLSATKQNASGLFVGLEDNGIRCVTTPCFSTDQYILNHDEIRSISNINLEKAGATQKQLELAYSIIAKGGVLLASGINRRIEEVTGTGTSFIANQFYLPILPIALADNACPDGYQYSDGECKTPIGCVAPELELWVYGGVRDFDLETGEETSNITKSCVDSCDPPAIPGSDAPGRCSVYLP
ncbi:MAG: DUF6748 domain-containing protein [Methylococcales bacterium]